LLGLDCEHLSRGLSLSPFGTLEFRNSKDPGPQGISIKQIGVFPEGMPAYMAFFADVFRDLFKA
jgi:hypothetical protein